METNPSSSQNKNNMLEQTQQQVNEVVGIMRVNVEKVLERDHKLSELDNRAEILQEGGKRFEQQAQKLKRKYWWQNLKMMIILGVIGVILLIIIIFSISSSLGGDSSTQPPPSPAQLPAATMSPAVPASAAPTPAAPASG